MHNRDSSRGRGRLREGPLLVVSAALTLIAWGGALAQNGTGRPASAAQSAAEVAAPAARSADPLSGDVTGGVVDDQGAVPGATVSLSGGQLARPLGAVTDAKGIYRFTDVPPGTYTVTVSLAGGRPIASAPFKVETGRQTKVPPVSVAVETVRVEASGHELVESGSTTIGTNFGAEKMQDIPTGRSYTDVVQLAAGVSKDDGTGGVAAYGSTGLESNYQIDGVSSTSVGSGRPSTQLHFDIIKEIEVKTGGYGAEFGGAQGALVNVTTKSGGDQFEGSLAYYTTPDSLASEPQNTGFGTALPVPDGQEVAGSLGGYLVKDKVFFYSGFSRKNSTATADQQFANLFARDKAEDTDDRSLYFFKTTWQVDSRSQLVASFHTDPGVQNFRDELGGPGGDHRVSNGGVDGLLQYTALGGGGRWSMMGRLGLHTEMDTLDPTDQQQQINPIGATRQTSTPSVRARCKDLSDPYCLGTAEGFTSSTTFGEPSLRFGPYPYAGDTNAKRRSVAGTLEGFLGKNTIKFGTEYAAADFSQSLDYGWGTGMSLDWLPVTSLQGDPTRPPVSIVGVRRCWGDGEGNCRQWDDQVQADGGTNTLSLFAQDSWSPTPRVTINYGLRWDAQQIVDDSGHSLVRMEKNFAPRLGATWDFTGENRGKLYGSWGRYYDQVPMQVVSRAFSPRITSTRLYRAENWSRQGFINDIDQHGICPSNDPSFDLGSPAHPTCWDFESKDLVDHPDISAYEMQDKVHTSQGLDGFGSGGLFPDTIVDSGSNFRAPIDPQLRGSSTDETLLGFEWSPIPRWKVGVLTIHRSLQDAIEDMSLDFGKNFIVANPGGPYHFFVDPANRDMVNPDYVPGSSDPAQQPAFAQIAGCAPGRVCTLSNDDLERLGYAGFPRATRRYEGIQFEVAGEVERRLWLDFTYLHSRTLGNYRGRYFVESEERDPNLTEAFDVPALTVNTDGALPQDMEHQVKLFGHYALTPNSYLGLTWRYTTGGPISATTDPTGGSTPFFGPLFLLQRGTAGRLPATQGVDLGLGYNIKDTGRLKMTVSLDIFNFLNEQKPIAVDEQFMATGVWAKPFPDGYGGVIFSPIDGSREGRGEPLLEYVDTAFGNADGSVSRGEWNNWAQSFQGRFSDLDELYQFLRTEKVTLNQGGEIFSAPAYPGFAGCPASLDDALRAGCSGINPGFGKSRLLEAPRTIRLGIRIAF
ncbi:MAG TPA: TonB-dependent receptor [Patescibacteria group bacterium]|nr:TonB-dependent receptor [Patescibacteria group bacterium]